MVFLSSFYCIERHKSILCSFFMNSRKKNYIFVWVDAVKKFLTTFRSSHRLTAQFLVVQWPTWKVPFKSIRSFVASKILLFGSDECLTASCIRRSTFDYSEWQEFKSDDIRVKERKNNWTFFLLFLFAVVSIKHHHLAFSPYVETHPMKNKKNI